MKLVVGNVMFWLIVDNVAVITFSKLKVAILVKLRTGQDLREVR